MTTNKNFDSDANRPYLIGKKEVAEMLGCSIRQVDYLRQREGLPFVKIGALIRFFPTHLDEWCKSRVQNAANATGVSKVENVSTFQNPETEQDSRKEG